jgi:DsbC/DsbD-like thiol-disulfide interchange protein
MAEDYSTSIDLDMLIGVCEEICIPATANFTLSPEAMNSSDPQISIRLLLANAKLPTISKSVSDIVEFKREGNQVRAKLLAPDASQRTRIVIAVTDRWTSDPIEFGKSGKGVDEASVIIPDSIMQSALRDENWEFSLITQKKDTLEVTSALEGKFTLGRN